ncbi:MAG TPA: GHKL domain-containing protein [Bacillota bacterium]|nr:GHKL domain-containing protein [Bacillota bacterium]
MAITVFTSVIIGCSLVDDLKKDYVWRFIYVSLGMSVFHLMSMFVINETYTILLIYLLFIPIMMVSAKSRFSQTVIAMLLALTYNLLFIHVLADNLLDIALQVSTVTSDPLIQMMFSLFISLTNIFIVTVIYRKNPVLFPARWFNIQIMEEKQSTLYRLHFTFIILILIAINAFLFYTYMELPTLSIHFRLFLMGWSVIICALFLFFSKNIVLYNIERMQFSLDQTYQKDLQAFYTIIRSQRHDFNIHLTSIYGLIEHGKYEECNRYIEEIVEETRDINHLLPLHYPAIGSLLYTYKELAMQKGISLEFHILYDLKHMPCNIYEMNKILGNLLENAIEATDQGSISVHIDKQYNQIMLSVSNAIAEESIPLDEIFTQGFTTKEKHEGIGLPAIQQIIAKYNGVMYPSIEERQLMMTVRIPLHQS